MRFRDEAPPTPPVEILLGNRRQLSKGFPGAERDEDRARIAMNLPDF